MSLRHSFTKGNVHLSEVRLVIEQQQLDMSTFLGQWQLCWGHTSASSGLGLGLWAAASVSWACLLTDWCLRARSWENCLASQGEGRAAFKFVSDLSLQFSLVQFSPCLQLPFSTLQGRQFLTHQWSHRKDQFLSSTSYWTLQLLQGFLFVLPFHPGLSLLCLLSTVDVHLCCSCCLRGGGNAHLANARQGLEVSLLSEFLPDRRWVGKQLRGICIKK